MTWVACRIVEYDTNIYPFTPAMLDALGIKDFNELPRGTDPTVTDPQEINGHYRKLLKDLPLDHPLIEFYYSFVSEFVAAQFASRLSYTKRPVLRVQIAHSPSISGMHRDSEYTGRWDYVNAWLPMLNVPAESSLHVESDYGSGQLTPIPMSYGQVLFFDAGMLMHGSPSNNTDQPRVSMDFRFVPKSPSRLKEFIVGSRPPKLVASSRATFDLLQQN